MMSLFQMILLSIAYLSGSIPFGYLLTKSSTGLNILEQGSGNIGSTNVGRIAGKRVALGVQLLDILKGLIPVSLVYFTNKTGFINFPDYFIYLVALSTIIGHDFSIFLQFSGGKGVNTTLGATLLLAPVAVFCAVCSYFIAKWLFGYASVGSIFIAFALPLSGAIFHAEYFLLYYLYVCCCLILVRHIPNIRRLFSGKELP